MVNRYSSAGSLRYGFNNKEKDNEDLGEGNSYDYGFRVYNPRLGRFLSIDPISHEYPNLTPYQYASNRPVDGTDRDGLEWFGVDPVTVYKIMRGILVGWADDAAEGASNIRDGVSQNGLAQNQSMGYNNAPVPVRVQKIMNAKDEAAGMEKIVHGTSQMEIGGIEGASYVIPIDEALGGVASVGRRTLGKAALRKVEQESISLGDKMVEGSAKGTIESSKALVEPVENNAYLKALNSYLIRRRVFL